MKQQPKQIVSAANPLYKELLKLASASRNRSRAGQTLLDGAHLVTACLDAGRLPERVLVNAAALADAEIAALLSRLADVEIVQLDDRLFSNLTELKSPSGIIAQIDIPGYQLSAGLCRFALLLEDIQDPGNLGSILRSAAAAGCDAVFLSCGCADAWSPRVLRAAMGGHFCIDIHENQDLVDVARKFPGRLYATHLKASVSLYDADLSGHLALMIGNEGAGLSDALLAFATDRISIPMPGRVESLNAAAAAAICLFESVRQRAACAGKSAPEVAK